MNPGIDVIRIYMEENAAPALSRISKHRRIMTDLIRKNKMKAFQKTSEYEEPSNSPTIKVVYFTEN